VLEGRDFIASDLDRPTHQTVISGSLARRLFGAASNAIGRRLSFGPDDPVTDWHEVIGVVGDVRQGSLTEPAGPRVYDLFGQHWGRTVYVIARGDADPQSMPASLRAVVHRIDPQAPVFELQSLDAIVAGTLTPRRLATALAVAMAVISGLLAAIALYALLAAAVASRTRELGIRRALGSTAWQVAQLVITEAATVAGVGAIAGVAAAIGAERLIRSQLFGVQPSDARIVGAVAAALCIVAAAAAYAPARRAMRVDPVIALRDE
jgi:putative ABC transport system permease protein